MTRKRPRVLLDTTSLRGESVLHGIGRYIYDLLVGLAETKREWEDQLAIETLVQVNWALASPVSEDLAAVAEAARAAKRSVDGALIAKRFLNLGRASIERRADVVHALQARGLPLVLPTRSVVTCYDIIPLRFPKEYLVTRAQHVSRFVRDWHRYRMPTRVAVISERTGRDLSLLRVPRDRIDVIPTGIDLTKWSLPDQPDDAARRARIGVEGKRFVVYVGYCDYRKNVRGMFESLALARKTADVELVWAGDLPPPQLAMVKDMARASGVFEGVRFLGYVPDEDLAALYRRAGALLFLSRLEGFGLPVAEAMAASCPSIVSRDSGSDEVAGDAGVVVDADDHAAAAGAILSLTELGDRRASLAKKGLARVSMFDRREMARAYVRSYHRALV